MKVSGKVLITKAGTTDKASLKFGTPLDDGDRITKRLYMDLPSYAPIGDYDIKFVLSQDDFTRVKYRQISII